MIIKLKKGIIKKIGYFSAIAILFTILIINAPFIVQNTYAINISNATVFARVNVSNNPPVLYKVVIVDPPIDLNAGTAAVVTCNGSYQDSNGYTDIMNVSATLYYNGTEAGASDNNNTHYTNSSCGPCSVIPGSNDQNGSCLCNFPVQYYANDGGWSCNMTINDSGYVASSENSSSFTINEVLGIQVETTDLNYGNMTVTQVSDAIRENITNIGNVPINVSVRGFGGINETTGQNISMICEDGDNITFNFQRYALSDTTAFANMWNLSNQSRQIINMSLPKRTEDIHYGNSTNTTYWRLQIPASSSGVCNGTIIFSALDTSDLN